MPLRKEFPAQGSWPFEAYFLLGQYLGSSTGGRLEPKSPSTGMEGGGMVGSLPLGPEAEVSVRLALQEEPGRLQTALHSGDTAPQVLQGLLLARLSG